MKNDLSYVKTIFPKMMMLMMIVCLCVCSIEFDRCLFKWFFYTFAFDGLDKTIKLFSLFGVCIPLPFETDVGTNADDDDDVDDDD